MIIQQKSTMLNMLHLSRSEETEDRRQEARGKRQQATGNRRSCFSPPATEAPPASSALLCPLVPLSPCPLVPLSPLLSLLIFLGNSYMCNYRRSLHVADSIDRAFDCPSERYRYNCSQKSSNFGSHKYGNEDPDWIQPCEITHESGSQYVVFDLLHEDCGCSHLQR